MGLPGKPWVVSSAWSETLTIKSSSLSWNSCHGLLRASDASSRYLSFRIFRATGDTSPLGLTPALKASNFAAPNSFVKYSAKMLRLAFQVQRNRIENFPCMIPDSKVKVPKVKNELTRKQVGSVDRTIREAIVQRSTEGTGFN